MYRLIKAVVGECAVVARGNILESSGGNSIPAWVSSYDIYFIFFFFKYTIVRFVASNLRFVLFKVFL